MSASEERLMHGYPHLTWEKKQEEARTGTERRPLLYIREAALWSTEVNSDFLIGHKASRSTTVCTVCSCWPSLFLTVCQITRRANSTFKRDLSRFWTSISYKSFAKTTLFWQILNKCWQCTAQQTPDMLVLHMSIMFEELTLRINTVSSGLVRTQNILGKDHFFCRHQQHVLERFSKNESESELWRSDLTGQGI